MHYSYKTPPAIIAAYVKGILVIENFNIANPFTLPLFANGCPTLVFQSKKAWLNNKSSGHLTLFGQTIQPGVLTIDEGFTLIAYFFKPHALVALFNIAGNELSDTYADFNLLPPVAKAGIQEKLLNCASVNGMLSIINHFIEDLICKKKTDVSKIIAATSLIETKSVRDSLQLAQDNLFVTKKTFQRMFEKNVGLSPRMFKRIWQFNTAFQQLNTRRFIKLSDIAYEAGYADQSHFTRSFKEFTHLTPKEYLDFGK